MKKPVKVTVDTLPQGGEFVLTLLTDDNNEKKVKGRFSMYALDRFCADKDLTYMQAIVKVSLGMRIGEYATLLRYALQDYFRSDYSQAGIDWDGDRLIWTDETVMDYIFEAMGGLGNQNMLKLFKHAIGRLGAILEDDGATDDKKKEEKPEN